MVRTLDCESGGAGSNPVVHPITRKSVVVDRLQELYQEEHTLNHELFQILWNERKLIR